MRCLQNLSLVEAMTLCFGILLKRERAFRGRDAYDIAVERLAPNETANATVRTIRTAGIDMTRCVGVLVIDARMRSRRNADRIFGARQSLDVTGLARARYRSAILGGRAAHSGPKAAVRTSNLAVSGLRRWELSTWPPRIALRGRGVDHAGRTVVWPLHGSSPIRGGSRR